IDGEQAVTVGSRRGICAACSTNAYLARRDGGGWRDLFPTGLGAVIPEPPQHPQSTNLGGLYLTGPDSGLAVGTRYYPGAAEIFGLRLSGGAWRYEQILPMNGASVTDVFMADPTRALVVGTDGLLVSYGYGPQAPAPTPAPSDNPARPVPNPNQAGVRFFPETSHTLRGPFLRYWEANGGLSRFGYPLTEEFAEVSSEDGRTYTVQYFERARFEYHPELAGTQYEVLLGLLGHWVTAERKGEAPFQPAPPTGRPGAVYFAETGHTMAPEFADHWRRNGGLPIYGYPISEAFYEVNAADGRSYLVQYFERNRFEYHPELAGTPYEVLLGLLGSEYLAAKGWR
ncbi:MAG TPA: hypothetical protein PKD53_34725, partial [Chloroflexaceae bacterium]|nr:hypothetical protein [Chloroflexaceae bacterium]